MVLLVTALLVLASPAAAQTSTSTITSAGAAAYLGAQLEFGAGPWVVGEVLFFSSDRLVSDYTWREKVRAQRGTLYTKADVLGDVENLMSQGNFERVEPRVYAIPDSPVPAEFAGVAASSAQVRLVFHVTEKKVSDVVTKPRAATPPAAVSGVVLTPTAWRGAGRYSTPGLGLDVNGMYVIGRLYGKNTFPNTPRQTNYIDRIGLWLLGVDGKMQVQSEAEIRPAVAFGGQATFMFRDSPQPTVQNQNVTVKVSEKSTKLFTAGYGVVSKKLGPVRTSVGVLQGNQGDIIANFSEFLTPEALRFYNNMPNSRISSRTVPFFSLFGLPKPSYPLGFEVMKFNGSPLSPWLVNFKLGYFLKMNFDLAYLKYKGGYDVLGVIQFRYNHFPRR